VPQMSFKDVASLITVVFIAFLSRIAVASMGLHGTDILYRISGVRSLLETGSPYCNATYTYPPLYSVIQLVGIMLLGWNVVGFKVMSIVFDVLIAVLLYLYIRRTAGNGSRCALYMALLWALNPLSIVASSWYGLFDSIPTFFSMISIYLTEKYVLSAITLGLGIAIKVFPITILPALAYATRRYGDVEKALTYALITLATVVAVEGMFVYRCPSDALNQQLFFHATRLDKGLSFIPALNMMNVLSTAAAMALSFTLLTFGISIEVSALLSLMVLNTLNSFIYPHYIIWFLPYLYIALAKIDRDRAVHIALLTTLLYSAIALAYWRFYKVTDVVEVLRTLYYVTTITLAIYVFRIYVN